MILDTLQEAADTLGLSLNVFLGITGTITLIVTLLIINQVVASLSDSKPTPQWNSGGL